MGPLTSPIVAKTRIAGVWGIRRFGGCSPCGCRQMTAERSCNFRVPKCRMAPLGVRSCSRAFAFLLENCCVGLRLRQPSCGWNAADQNALQDQLEKSYLAIGSFISLDALKGQEQRIDFGTRSTTTGVE
jgi:hypothetical protein